jgi:hypothetical protein
MVVMGSLLTAAESREDDFAVAAHSCDFKADPIQLRTSVYCAKRPHRFRRQQDVCHVLHAGVRGESHIRGFVVDRGRGQAARNPGGKRSNVSKLSVNLIGIVTVDDFLV